MEETNEVKLQAIIDELPNLVRMVKMMLAIQTTLEGYRQYVTGELPEEFVELVSGDAFKSVFNHAIKANQEIMGNITVFVNKIGVIIGKDLMGPLPTNPEEFKEMQEELHEEIIGSKEAEDDWLNFDKE